MVFICPVLVILHCLHKFYNTVIIILSDLIIYRKNLCMNPNRYLPNWNASFFCCCFSTLHFSICRRRFWLWPTWNVLSGSRRQECMRSDWVLFNPVESAFSALKAARGWKQVRGGQAGHRALLMWAGQFWGPLQGTLSHFIDIQGFDPPTTGTAPRLRQHIVLHQRAKGSPRASSLICTVVMVRVWVRQRHITLMWAHSAFIPLFLFFPWLSVLLFHRGGSWRRALWILTAAGCVMDIHPVRVQWQRGARNEISRTFLPRMCSNRLLWDLKSESVDKGRQMEVQVSVTHILSFKTKELLYLGHMKNEFVQVLFLQTSLHWFIIVKCEGEG